jgi:hypothetical protein
VLRTGTESVSDGVWLLADIRALFALHGTDRLPTARLVNELRAIKESSWGGDGDTRAWTDTCTPDGAPSSPFTNGVQDHRPGHREGYVTYGTDRQVGLLTPGLATCRASPASVGNPVTPLVRRLQRIRGYRRIGTDPADPSPRAGP